MEPRARSMLDLHQLAQGRNIELARRADVSMAATPQDMLQRIVELACCFRFTCVTPYCARR